jgi:hypothetical protein
MAPALGAAIPPVRAELESGRRNRQPRTLPNHAVYDEGRDGFGPAWV